LDPKFRRANAPRGEGNSRVIGFSRCGLPLASLLRGCCEFLLLFLVVWDGGGPRVRLPLLLVSQDSLDHLNIVVKFHRVHLITRRFLLFFLLPLLYSVQVLLRDADLKAIAILHDRSLLGGSCLASPTPLPPLWWSKYHAALTALISDHLCYRLHESLLRGCHKCHNRLHVHDGSRSLLGHEARYNQFHLDVPCPFLELLLALLVHIFDHLLALHVSLILDLLPLFVDFSFFVQLSLSFLITFAFFFVFPALELQEHGLALFVFYFIWAFV
jgi:hypothetical protein